VLLDKLHHTYVARIVHEDQLSGDAYSGACDVVDASAGVDIKGAHGITGDCAPKMCMVLSRLPETIRLPSGVTATTKIACS
jgi:hypothetical protein